MVRLGQFLAKYGGSLAGLLGMTCITAGIWGLGGWQWGLITAGLPVAAFYVWGEVLKVRRKLGGAD